MTPFLQFQPIYQERVWGGRALASFLGRKLPGTAPIGESWELVDRPEAQSVVIGGPWAGRTLREIMATHAGEIMGPAWPATRPFPILVKWLDCRERLSLQVHPPAAVAARLGGEAKTENWYVARAEPGAAVLAGLQPGVDAARFRAALQDNSAESLVHRLPTAAGDSLLIHSGVMHAIDGGNMILEIQQNSDTTYRVYDWGRVGLDGWPRTLHVAESLQSIDWNDFEPAPVRAAPTSGTIADTPEFSIRRVVLGAGERFHTRAGEQARILSVVSGTVRASLDNSSGSRPAFGQKLERGDNALLPFAGAFTFSAEATAILLVTENFS
jgi:mannose-6-phosphate isomerase